MKYFIGLLIGALFIGCAKLGPDFQKRDEIRPPKALDKNATISQDDLALWWHIFHDDTLNQLVTYAYRNNIDLKQAGLRILQARTLLGVSQSFRYPQLSTLSASAITTQKGTQTLQNVNVSFDLGWEIDFWGKYARQIESAQADLYLSVASYRDIATTVVAEVVRNYIDYKVACERIAYAKRNIAVQERIVQITQVRLRSGNVSELDMQQAKTQLYATKAKLPALYMAKLNAYNALGILLGVDGDTLKTLLPPCSYNEDSSYVTYNTQTRIELSENVQEELSLDIVPTASIDPYAIIDIATIMRRPDIQAAEFRARSASAKIGATQALLYPSFQLFGSIAIGASAFNGRWPRFVDEPVLSAGPALQWNVFQFGRIKNQVRFADAAFEEAMLGYNKVLLVALSEVSNALNGYVYARRQLQETKKALHATVRAFNLSAKQYAEGLVSYQRLLSTVEKLTLIQDAYAQTKGLASLEAVLLYKALGGGWQATQDMPYIDTKTIRKLRDSGVDWGDYLKHTRLENE